MVKNIILFALMLLILMFAGTIFSTIIYYDYKRDAYNIELKNLLQNDFDLIVLYDNEENIIDNYLSIHDIHIPINHTVLIGFAIDKDDPIFLRVPIYNCKIIEDNDINIPMVKLILSLGRGRIMEFGKPPSLKNLRDQFTRSLKVEFHFPVTILRGKHRLFEDILSERMKNEFTK